MMTLYSSFFVFCLLFLQHFAIGKHGGSGGGGGSNGQRIFVDSPVRVIELIDSAKHGFHVILNDQFVKTHLRPVHAPTIYATAVAVRSTTRNQHHKSRLSVNNNETADNKIIDHEEKLDGGSSRVTKIFFPEPDADDASDGLLADGRTIKLMGLRERTWYYVCVEYESNLRRRELISGLSCQLRRTLDKFGKDVQSTVRTVDLADVTDRSISVKLTVDTDFPLRLYVYLYNDAYLDEERISKNNNNDAFVSTPPTQVFLISGNGGGEERSINIDFGGGSDQSHFLIPNSEYGQICILEEPLDGAYTAVGRYVKPTLEQCYFNRLKTKAKPVEVTASRKIHHHQQSVSGLSAQSQIRRQSPSASRSASFSSADSTSQDVRICLIVSLFVLLIFCWIDG